MNENNNAINLNKNKKYMDQTLEENQNFEQFKDTKLEEKKQKEQKVSIFRKIIRRYVKYLKSEFADLKMTLKFLLVNPAQRIKENIQNAKNQKIIIDENRKKERENFIKTAHILNQSELNNISKALRSFRGIAISDKKQNKVMGVNKKQQNNSLSK